MSITEHQLAALAERRISTQDAVISRLEETIAEQKAVIERLKKALNETSKISVKCAAECMRIKLKAEEEADETDG